MKMASRNILKLQKEIQNENQWGFLTLFEKGEILFNDAKKF